MIAYPVQYDTFRNIMRHNTTECKRGGQVQPSPDKVSRDFAIVKGFRIGVALSQSAMKETCCIVLHCVEELCRFASCCLRIEVDYLGSRSYNSKVLNDSTPISQVAASMARARLRGLRRIEMVQPPYGILPEWVTRPFRPLNRPFMGLIMGIMWPNSPSW